MEPPGTPPPGDQDVRDRALLAAHLAGDGEAFGALVAAHSERLWAVAVRTLGDREEAADALQDAMVSAFRRADSYRQDAAVTTWLHRIVVNACLDRLRRRRVRMAEPLPEEPAEGGWPGADRTSAVGPGGPEVIAEQHAVREAVVRALAELPVEQRTARLVELGITPAVARGMAAGQGAEMGRCILRLYRSSAQPVMRQLGEDLPAAARRPGLVVVPTEDHYVGTVELRRRAAARSGAEAAVLDGLGHWWMVQDPNRAAQVLSGFWADPG